jgi:hypothetical protein
LNFWYQEATTFRCRILTDLDLRGAVFAVVPGGKCPRVKLY